ncbi:MAG TPA: DUF3999 family protein, partial [Povalibacter sp.]|nr:DUF3999 family protein [Povalibacter sp.]
MREWQRRSGIGTLLLLAAATPASAKSSPDDYSQGMRVDLYAGKPLADLQLPDAVYKTVTRADLGDVSVFNADGFAVPHAFCASAIAAEPIVSREPLPVFELQAPAQTGSSGTHVEVETAAGTQVRVQEGDAAPTEPGTRTWAHVIDARGITDELHSIEFDWSSPDGASQANVRVEASSDLDQWRTVVNGSTLLRVEQGGRQLQRKTVQLMPQHYDYLRVVRTDGGPPLQIAVVIGERVTRAPAIEPVWFSANPLTSATPGELLFDAGHIAPVTYARVVLPQINSSVRVSLQSRPDDQAQWRDRWSGEVYSVMTGGQHRSSPAAAVDGDHDRYWRLVYAKPSDA